MWEFDALIGRAFGFFHNSKRPEQGNGSTDATHRGGISLQIL